MKDLRSLGLVSRIALLTKISPKCTRLRKMISKAPTEPQDAEEHVSNAGEELSQLCGVIQRIFFKIRESTFDTSISKVETEDDKRYFYKKPREAHVAFDPLPDGLSEDDKAAVLSYMRCAYSVSLMWNIQKLLLKG